jgi:hypothetical protein
VTRLVPIKDLRIDYPGWVNPREFTGLSDKELDELAGDIKSAGDKGEKGKIIDPPKVVQIRSPDGLVDLVIDGQRRVLAGLRVLPKGTEIEVVDLEDEPIDELTPEIADDLTGKAIRMFHREGLSSYELSTVAERLRANKRELADIAAIIHRSESWVSRMLKARTTATAKLLAAWKKGEITDEQFKDLAAQKDAATQDATADQVIETRKSGNKAEARSTAKEIVETAKQKKAREKAEKVEAKARAKADKLRAKAEAKAAKAAKKKAGKATNGHATVTGEQQEMGWTPPPEVTKPKKPAAPPRVALEEIIALADKRPPTHDYVKGVIAGVRHATGGLELHQMAKPWAAWVSRVGGATASKKATSRKATPTIRAKKARTPNKARKPIAKSTKSAKRKAKKR